MKCLSYWLCYIYSLVKLVKFLSLCYRMLCFWWIKIIIRCLSASPGELTAFIQIPYRCCLLPPSAPSSVVVVSPQVSKPFTAVSGTVTTRACIADAIIKLRAVTDCHVIDDPGSLLAPLRFPVAPAVLARLSADCTDESSASSWCCRRSWCAHQLRRTPTARPWFKSQIRFRQQIDASLCVSDENALWDVVVAEYLPWSMTDWRLKSMLAARTRCKTDV